MSDQPRQPSNGRSHIYLAYSSQTPAANQNVAEAAAPAPMREFVRTARTVRTAEIVEPFFGSADEGQQQQQTWHRLTQFPQTGARIVP